MKDAISLQHIATAVPIIVCGGGPSKEILKNYAMNFYLRVKFQPHFTTEVLEAALRIFTMMEDNAA